MSELKFKFKMPDDESLAEYISVKGEKGERGDPTKLSQLENDTGFVTANTDALANYYTKAQTDSAIDADVEALETELGVPDGFFTDTTETVTGQGTTITLNGTSNAVFKDIKLYGATVQNGTPTPESPVEIQTVTGEQTIIITDNDQQSQSYTLSLGDIELCKVENYQDYIWKDGDKWKLHKEVGKVVLDGSIAAWGYYASGNNTVFMLDKSDASYGSATSNPILTSRFKSKFAAENGCIFLSSASRRLNICTDITDNPVDWRSWLASNPATAYYALATATDEELTNQTLISQLNALLGARTFEGQTLVTANGEISTGLYVEAFQDNWSGSMAGVDANLAELKEEVDAKASLVEFAMKPYYFDTVAEMKSANLDEGDCCITLGYYSANDGGGAKYKIIDSEETADDGSIIALNNGLKAQLIVENKKIDVKQFGAVGDGETDDTIKIQTAINKAQSGKLEVFVSAGTYSVTGLSVTAPITIKANNQTGKIINASDSNPAITINHEGGQSAYERTSLSGLYIDGGEQEGIHMTAGNVILNENARIINCSTAVNVNGGNIFVDNIRIDNAETGFKISTTDNHLNNVTSHNCMVHYEDNGGFNICKNIHGWNYDSQNKDWTTGSIFYKVNCYQVQIINCYADTLNKVFDVVKTTSQYVLIGVQNLNFFLNRSSYPDTKPAPVLVNSFSGKLSINSVVMDYNGYVGDGSGNVFNYPNNVRINNFTANGAKFTDNYYYAVYDDTTSAASASDTADQIITLSDYLSNSKHKILMRGKSRFLDYAFTLKRGLPANTEIWTATLQNKMSGLNDMQLQCYAYQNGVYYPLVAYIANDTLHVINQGDLISAATKVVLKGSLEQL